MSLYLYSLIYQNDHDILAHFIVLVSCPSLSPVSLDDSIGNSMLNGVKLVNNYAGSFKNNISALKLKAAVNMSSYFSYVVASMTATLC